MIYIIKENIDLSGSDADLLSKEITKAWHEVFPHSFINAFAEHTGNSSDICIKTALGKDKTEFSNGIWQNDPLFGVYFIWGFKADGSYGPKIQLDSSSASVSGIKPPADSNLYYSSIKFFRKITCEPEKMLPKIKQMFKKIHDIVKENKDNFVNPEFPISSKL